MCGIVALLLANEESWVSFVYRCVRRRATLCGGFLDIVVRNSLIRAINTFVVPYETCCAIPHELVV